MLVTLREHAARLRKTWAKRPKQPVMSQLTRLCVLEDGPNWRSVRPSER